MTSILSNSQKTDRRASHQTIGRRRQCVDCWQAVHGKGQDSIPSFRYTTSLPLTRYIYSSFENHYYLENHSRWQGDKSIDYDRRLTIPIIQSHPLFFISLSLITTVGSRFIHYLKNNLLYIRWTSLTHSPNSWQTARIRKYDWIIQIRSFVLYTLLAAILPTT